MYDSLSDDSLADEEQCAPILCPVLCAPHPLTQEPLHTPWEEVCCAVATLNQHRPNEVSHLTPSSLSPSHGCQSHNEQPSISSAWLTHFDSWESLGSVRSKLPLSKCHHQHIHQPYLWIRPFLSFQKTIPPQNQQFCPPDRPLKAHLRTITPLNTLHTNESTDRSVIDHLPLQQDVRRLPFIGGAQWEVQPSAANGSLSDELCVPQVLEILSSDLMTQMWTGPHS